MDHPNYTDITLGRDIKYKMPRYLHTKLNYKRQVLFRGLFWPHTLYLSASLHPIYVLTHIAFSHSSNST